MRHSCVHGLVLLGAAAQAGAVSLNELALDASAQSERRNIRRSLAESERGLRSAGLLSEGLLRNTRSLSAAEAAVDQTTDAVARYLLASSSGSAVMVDFAGSMQRSREVKHRAGVNLSGPPATRLSAARSEHPWSWNAFGSIGCHSIDGVPGAVALTYDECRAVVMMDSTRHPTEALTFGDPFAVTSSAIPAGCSVELKQQIPDSNPDAPPANPLIYYNFDPVGGAAADYGPICKEPGYTMFAGGCPPPMFISVTAAECEETAGLFQWPWGAVLEEAELPGGCFGKDGFMYFNSGVNGVHEFVLGTDAFSICEEPTAGPEPGGFVAPAAEPPPGMFAPGQVDPPQPPFNSFTPGAGAPALPGAGAPGAGAAAPPPFNSFTPGAGAPALPGSGAPGAAPGGMPAAQAPGLPDWAPDWAVAPENGLGAATGAAAAGAFAPMAAAAAAPAPAPAASGASAVGDPHMTTITGVKFDLSRTGNHTLLHIPRFSAQEEQLLDVRATVKHEGATCLDMYIDALRITGKWADDKKFGGISFSAGDGSQVSGHWMEFGKLQLKVAQGITDTGVKYLNVLLKHLTKVGVPMGGILGLDDHTEAATPEEHCRRSLTL